MKRFLLGFLALFALTLVAGVAPQSAEAQWGVALAAGEECARCKKCGDCDGSDWGGQYCTFKGGCCREKGGNCSPALVLNTVPDDQLLIDIDGEDVLTVRLADNLFGTWACEDGVLSVAYTVDEEGTPQPVSDEELAKLKERFTFKEYLLNLEVAQDGEQAS